MANNGSQPPSKVRMQEQHQNDLFSGTYPDSVLGEYVRTHIRSVSGFRIWPGCFLDSVRFQKKFFQKPEIESYVGTLKILRDFPFFK